MRLSRPEKRNAIDDPTVLGLETFFNALPDSIKAVVIHGSGEHFCAGLDLTELTVRNVAQGIEHSRMWHRVFERIEFGRLPVVAVLHGAVVGGGLELAAAAMCAWPSARPFTRCQKAAAASMWAAALRCGCRGSSASRA